MPDDYIDLAYDAIIARTEKAILFLIGDEERWVPKSLIEDPDELEEGGGDVSIQFWFVEKEGLEDYT